MHKRVTDDPIESLLYSLLRDYVQPGEMERLVVEIEENDLRTECSNGYLLDYVDDIVTRLRKKKAS